MNLVSIFLESDLDYGKRFFLLAVLLFSFFFFPLLLFPHDSKYFNMCNNMLFLAL